MPTLADIYSAIDSAKRRGSDFVRNPGASLQQMLGYANDRARNLNEQTAAAAQEGASYGPASQALAMKMAEGYNPMGMTVYHGSPHLFQKFDLAKIGTGEGAQAYGHGLYMAESQGVGRDYATVLASPRNRVSDKRGVYVEPSPMGDGTWRLGTTSEIGKMRGQTGDATQGLTDYEFKNVASAVRYAKKKGLLSKDEKPVLNEIASEGAYNPVRSAAQMEDPLYNQLIASDPGYLYKVDLPDTHIRRMLDWDAKLKDQPIAVRRLAKSLGMDLNDLGGDLLAIVGKDEAGRQTLQNAGIRGVKYLDQQSRDATQGTRNFVVFDPNHLTIRERNQQPIK